MESTKITPLDFLLLRQRHLRDMALSVIEQRGAEMLVWLSGGPDSDCVDAESLQHIVYQALDTLDVACARRRGAQVIMLDPTSSVITDHPYVRLGWLTIVPIHTDKLPTSGEQYPHTFVATDEGRKIIEELKTQATNARSVA